MKPMLPVLLAGALFCVHGAAVAQDTPAQNTPVPGHADALITQSLPAPAALRVRSPSFRDGRTIPFAYTQYRGNVFPGLVWSRGPKGVRSYLVVMQGAPERPGARTSIHLTLYNIPPETRRLPVGMTVPPRGAVYGPNVHGRSAAYAGPHTHVLTPQAYHLQVLALDIDLPVVADQDFAAILAAARGHVLAAGDLVGYAGMDPASPEAAKLRAAPAAATTPSAGS